MAPDESGPNTPGTTDRQAPPGGRRGRTTTGRSASRSRGWQAYLTPVLDFLLVFTTMVALAALTASFLIL